MASTFAQRLAKGFIAMAALFSIFTVNAFAADTPPDTGKVTINVTDENDAKYNGNWYLYKGLVQYSWAVRNGTNGEVFNFPPSTYTLEARAVPGDHPYYLIHSENPQTLVTGGSIVFNVQYFKTEEQFLNAKNGLTTPTPVTPATSPTTPAPVAEPAPAVVNPSAQDTFPYPRTPLSAWEGSTPAYIYDHSIVSDVPTASEPTPVYQLAETGPAEALPLVAIFSSLVGYAVVRRKRN